MTLSVPAVQPPRPATPLPPWPVLDPATVALGRLVGHGRSAALPALGTSATLAVWRAGSVGIHAGSSDWTGALDLAGDFGTLRLAHGSRLLHALTGIDLDGIDDAADARWPWLESAVLGRLAGTPLAGTRRLAPAGPQRAQGSGGDDGDDGGDRLVLPLTLQDGSHRITTQAAAGPACWLALLHTGGWTQAAPPRPAPAWLATAWPLQLARHRLAPAQLRRCRPGDVIVPEHAAFDCAGHGTLALGSYRLRVRFDRPTSITILALEQTMSDVSPFSATAQFSAAEADSNSADPTDLDGLVGLATLDELPLALDFELGSLRLTLAQLRQLGSGAVLELEQPSTAQVRIVCGGRQLGRGTPVDVGGRLGIRLTEWVVA